MLMKRKKDVLFLCQYFYPEYISSATLPYDTAEALVKAGFSVGALCGYPREYNKSGQVPKKQNHNGIEIKRLKYIQLKRSNFVGRLINYFSFTASVLLRFGYLRNYKSIIVYSNPPILPLVAALANRFFGTKMIFVSYDVYPEMAHITNSISEGSIISTLMKFINKIIFRYVYKVVALSSEMKTYLIEHRPLLREQQIEVIPNWYEDRKISDISKAYENKMFKDIRPKENLVISYFGNMGICQDLETILDAIRELKDDNNIKFLFAGHGNKMGTLKSVVEEEKLINVTIFDFLHGQDFQDALNISDCFIVSLAEGLTGLAVPSKTYSYMMAGKPIIAIMEKHSDISKDLIENEAGYSIEVGQVSELVNAIKELKNNRVKRELMGKNCRKVFLAKYTKEICTKQYVDMMRRVLEA
jgi:glycosyltransferase involved in cell wall biosynthesis